MINALSLTEAFYLSAHGAMEFFIQKTNLQGRAFAFRGSGVSVHVLFSFKELIPESMAAFQKLCPLQLIHSSYDSGLFTSDIKTSDAIT